MTLHMFRLVVGFLIHNIPLRPISGGRGGGACRISSNFSIVIILVPSLSGQPIGISIFHSRAVTHCEIEWLETKRPSGSPASLVFDRVEPLQTLVIGNHFERNSSQVYLKNNVVCRPLWQDILYLRLRSSSRGSGVFWNSRPLACHCHLLPSGSVLLRCHS